MAARPEGEPTPCARERIEAAAIDLAAEHGYEATTIEMVVERAGVTRADFDRHFAGKEDCALQLYEENLGRFVSLVLAAARREPDWRDSMRAGGYAAARFLRDNPRLAQVGVIQMLAAGSMAEARRAGMMDPIVDLIDAGRNELEDPDSIGRGVAEAVLGSIYEITIRDLAGGLGTGAAEKIVPQLMYVAVRPYVGHELAREELELPPPPEPDKALDDHLDIQGPKAE
jgi:AcrR family transcriptional regulator